MYILISSKHLNLPNNIHSSQFCLFSMLVLQVQLENVLDSQFLATFEPIVIAQGKSLAPGRLQYNSCMKITSFGSGQAQRCVISTPFPYHFLVHLQFDLVSLIQAIFLTQRCRQRGCIPGIWGFRKRGITTSTSGFGKLSTAL